MTNVLRTHIPPRLLPLYEITLRQLQVFYKGLDTDVTSFCILSGNEAREVHPMKQEDIIIYGCVIIGAGIGLLVNNAFPGVLIGLGVGYVLKSFTTKNE